MSNEDAQERTEAPTAKKLEDARKKGQVPRSVDLGAAAVTRAATGALMLFGADAARSLMGMLASSLSIRGGDLVHDDIMIRNLGASSGLALLGMMPLLAATLVAALASPALIGGWTFSTESLGFKPERLDPI